jgi:hypothetical protein
MHRPLVPVVQPDGDQLLAAGGGHGGDGAGVEEAQLAAPVAADPCSNRGVADQARPYLKQGVMYRTDNLFLTYKSVKSSYSLLIMYIRSPQKSLKMLKKSSCSSVLYIVQVKFFNYLLN